MVKYKAWLAEEGRLLVTLVIYSAQKRKGHRTKAATSAAAKILPRKALENQQTLRKVTDLVAHDYKHLHVEDAVAPGLVQLLADKVQQHGRPRLQWRG